MKRRDKPVSTFRRGEIPVSSGVRRFAASAGFVIATLVLTWISWALWQSSFVAAKDIPALDLTYTPPEVKRTPIGVIGKEGDTVAMEAAAKEVPEGSKTVLVEFVAQETEQNHRVISSIKKLDEIAGAPGKTRSISSLRLKDCAGKDESDAGCAKAKQTLNTAPKVVPPMNYDAMIPGGKPIGGLTPWSAAYNSGK